MSGLFKGGLVKSPRYWFGRVTRPQHRTVFTQDAVFGFENRKNLERMIRYEKSGGPSLVMNASRYGLEVPFFTDHTNIAKNEDTAQLFGLWDSELNPLCYIDYPRTIWKSVRDRNGLLEISLQYDKAPWNPDRLITYLAEHGTGKLERLLTSDLFDTYLGRLNLTDQEIEKIYTQQIDDTITEIAKEDNYKSYLMIQDYFSGGLTTNPLKPEIAQAYIHKVRVSEEATLSFTDVEFGFFFFMIPPEERGNLAIVLNGGGIANTADICDRLLHLLRLKERHDEPTYEAALKAFQDRISGSSEGLPEAAGLINSIRGLPAIDGFLQRASDFKRRNFESLCLKMVARYENRPSERAGLLTVLQFRQPKGAPPIVVPVLMYDEGGGVQIQELLPPAGEGSFFTWGLATYQVQLSLETATPSANFCYVGNVRSFLEKTRDCKRSSDFLVRTRQLYQLLSVLSHDIRDIDGQSVSLPVGPGHWRNLLKYLDAGTLLTCDFTLRKNPPLVAVGPDRADGEDAPFETVLVDALENYHFRLGLTGPFPHGSSTGRKKDKLPEGYSLPTIFPHHLGAAEDLKTDFGFAVIED
ncbi:hypothetical protein [Sneathiella chinensis]|uniref:Uncharacterized protein n=1 Tax=Sneathiella chinensis TaxID=349750 RepID=A0ABQ5U5D7_9PROT|nr:hypothetical protein [Sneathiella chinensis]GLQ07380.1 hypothetical protein GCM10007924_26010 [Sneathiella chinensis]